MATLNVVILPAKKMANNKHKVRIMVSHNSQTRYIVTDILLDSPSELKNGKVVKRSDKDLLNLRIKKIYDTYFDRYLKLDINGAPDCQVLPENLNTIKELNRAKRLCYHITTIYCRNTWLHFLGRIGHLFA